MTYRMARMYIPPLLEGFTVTLMVKYHLIIDKSDFESL